MENIVTEIQEARSVNAREKVSAYFELTKPRIAFMLVLTAAAGFYLGSDKGFDWMLFLNSMLGITFLAFGVATLNQFIERNIDALMERTAKRPLPSRQIKRRGSALFSAFCFVSARKFIWLFWLTL